MFCWDCPLLLACLPPNIFCWVPPWLFGWIPFPLLLCKPNADLFILLPSLDCALLPWILLLLKKLPVGLAAKLLDWVPPKLFGWCPAPLLLFWTLPKVLDGLPPIVFCWNCPLLLAWNPPHKLFWLPPWLLGWTPYWLLCWIPKSDLFILLPSLECPLLPRILLLLKTFVVGYAGKLLLWVPPKLFGWCPDPWLLFWTLPKLLDGLPPKMFCWDCPLLWACLPPNIFCWLPPWLFGWIPFPLLLCKPNADLFILLPILGCPLLPQVRNKTIMAR